jgi:prepilin-type N-terminal cleavage/methylation domain-containing protein
MRDRHSRAAFTLVELLVVIGIIAVLVAILLPALSRARKHALRVAELSNMRQVGLAVHMYANDNKGRLPGGSGNNGPYPHSHDVVRTRLCGYRWDEATNGYMKTGPSYLQPALDQTYLGWAYPGAMTRIWGCPLTADTEFSYRYSASWWWNAGCMETCDADGKDITCIPNNTKVNWWETDAANLYNLTINGGGYKDRFGRQPNPDNIVLITDAGGPIYTGAPAPGHLRANFKDPSDVEGTCTLFVSGRALWRNRSELQYQWTGGTWGWR